MKSAKASRLINDKNSFKMPPIHAVSDPRLHCYKTHYMSNTNYLLHLKMYYTYEAEECFYYFLFLNQKRRNKEKKDAGFLHSSLVLEKLARILLHTIKEENLTLEPLSMCLSMFRSQNP